MTAKDNSIWFNSHKDITIKEMWENTVFVISSGLKVCPSSSRLRVLCPSIVYGGL
jgi:hypothetical protein